MLMRYISNMEIHKLCKLKCLRNIHHCKYSYQSHQLTYQDQGKKYILYLSSHNFHKVVYTASTYMYYHNNINIHMSRPQLLQSQILNQNSLYNTVVLINKLHRVTYMPSKCLKCLHNHYHKDKHLQLAFGERQCKTNNRFLRISMFSKVINIMDKYFLISNSH